MKFFRPGRLLAAGLLLLLVAGALFVIPSDDYIFLPDRAHPVAPLVSVAGGHDPTGGGGIYYVDVRERKASLLEELFGGLHQGATLYPASAINPPGVSHSEVQQLDRQDMRTSQQTAAVVALRALGRRVETSDTGAVVTAVDADLPAAGKLRPGDVIVAVDGSSVSSPADVTRLMKRPRVGQVVRFAIRRGRATRVVPIATVAAHGTSRPIVGVLLDQAQTVELPIRVSIDAGNVGGPSAGLAFALDIMEELGHNVDRGYKIAATGEISPDGVVRPIGGIKQKTIGAREAGVDAFLVPAGENARDARKYAHGLRIIPVESFQQALRALATLPTKPS